MFKRTRNFQYLGDPEWFFVYVSLVECLYQEYWNKTINVLFIWFWLDNRLFFDLFYTYEVD